MQKINIYAKFSEKQTFITPWYVHVRIRGYELTGLHHILITAETKFLSFDIQIKFTAADFYKLTKWIMEIQNSAARFCDSFTTKTGLVIALC